jgi:hypothetical protein
MVGKMKNSFKKKQESVEQISTEKFDEIATGIEHFIKYQLPLHDITNNPHLQDSEYEELNPDNNVSYHIFKQDPLAQFLSSKRRFLNKSLDEIIELINEREQIRDNNFYQINKDICMTYTQMLKLSLHRYNINFGTDKVYNTLKQQVVALNREKRAEEVACWKDVIHLKSYLRESLKEAEQEKRKQSILLGK